VNQHKGSHEALLIEGNKLYKVNEKGEKERID
jgi:hypothetical protein